MDEAHRVVAELPLVRRVGGVEDDPQLRNLRDVSDRPPAVLQLLPDAIDCLAGNFDLETLQQPRQVDVVLDLLLELPRGGLDHRTLRLPEPIDRLFRDSILLRHRILEAQLFELLLDGVQPQQPGQRREHLQRLEGDPPLLGLRHARHRPHVVQPVCQLDHNNPHLLRHRQEQKLQILCLFVVRRSCSRSVQWYRCS